MTTATMRMSRVTDSDRFNYEWTLPVVMKAVSHVPEMRKAVIEACDKPGECVWVAVPGAPSVGFQLIGGVR